MVPATQACKRNGALPNCDSTSELDSEKSLNTPTYSAAHIVNAKRLKKLFDLKTDGGPVSQHQCTRVIAKTSSAQGLCDLIKGMIAPTANERTGLQASPKLLPCQCRSNLT